jgi:flagellar hook-length control protein FliK
VLPVAPAAPALAEVPPPPLALVIAAEAARAMPGTPAPQTETPANGAPAQAAAPVLPAAPAPAQAPAAPQGQPAAQVPAPAADALPADGTPADAATPTAQDTRGPQPRAPHADAPAPHAPTAPAQPPAAERTPAAEPTTSAPAAAAAAPAAAKAEPQPAAAAPAPTAPTAPAAGPGAPASAPVAAPAAPQRTVPLHRVPAAVSTLLHVAAERGITHAKMALRPAELGGVEIRLQATSAGIAAQVVADSPEAARLLAQAGDDLRRALEARDVTLLSLEVSTSSDQQQQSARGEWSDGDGADSGLPTSGRSTGDAEGDAEPAPTTQSVIELPGGLLVDVLA